MKLKQFDIDKLKEHPENYNHHPESQINELVKSLDTFDQFKNIVVWEGGLVIAGNGLFQAAKKMGLKSLWCVDRSDLSEKQAKALLIADNATSALSLPNSDDLNELLKDLSDFDIPGVNDDFLVKMNLDFSEPEPAPDSDAEPQIDKAKELNQKWEVKPGDMFQIGNHRLLCGDCTVKDDVDRIMGGEKSELLFTSPPYSDMRTYEGVDVAIGKLSKIFNTFAEISNFLIINLGLKFKDAEVVQYWDEWIKAGKESGFKLLAWNVWDKTQAGSIAQATNMFNLTHEWLFVFGENRKRLNRTIPNQIEKYESRHGKNFLDGFTHGRRETNDIVSNTTSKAYIKHQLHSVIQQTPETVRKNHPAVMPVGLPSEYIKAMTDENDIVTEPFLGSGTTMVASENLNRRCFGMEISENYCAVILERMEKAFGLTGLRVDRIKK